MVCFQHSGDICSLTYLECALVDFCDVAADVSALYRRSKLAMPGTTLHSCLSVKGKVTRYGRTKFCPGMQSLLKYPSTANYV